MEPLDVLMGICFMSNIFDTLVVYDLSWNEKAGSRRSLTDGEKKRISKVVVTESEYGKSLCFTMISGGHTYIPLSKTCDVLVDTEVPIDKVELFTIERVGDDDRVKSDIKE